LYDTLTVHNVLGKRSFLAGSGEVLKNLEKATLFFEKNGKEANIVLVR
jgi:hypothetical protein